MSVRLITIVFISEQPRLCTLSICPWKFGRDRTPITSHSHHLVSSSEVTFDIKLLMEVGTERVRGLCKVIFSCCDVTVTSLLTRSVSVPATRLIMASPRPVATKALM